MLLCFACYRSPAGQALQFSESFTYVFGFMLLLVYAPKLLDKFLALRFGSPASSTQEIQKTAITQETIKTAE